MQRRMVPFGLASSAARPWHFPPVPMSTELQQSTETPVRFDLAAFGRVEFREADLLCYEDRALEDVLKRIDGNRRQTIPAQRSAPRATPPRLTPEDVGTFDLSLRNDDVPRQTAKYWQGERQKKALTIFLGDE